MYFSHQEVQKALAALKNIYNIGKPLENYLDHCRQ